MEKVGRLYRESLVNNVKFLSTKSHIECFKSILVSSTKVVKKRISIPKEQLIIANCYYKL